MPKEQTFKIDRTYKPRIYRCEECKHVLGVVLRDSDRIRRLWVLKEQLQNETMLPNDTAIFTSAESTYQGRVGLPGLWRVRGLDSGTVGCEKCGSLQKWHPIVESLRDHIRQIRGDAGVILFDRLMKCQEVPLMDDTIKSLREELTATH